MAEMPSIKEQQAAEEEAERKADFTRSYGGSDPEGAWRVQQAVEEAEQKGAARAAKPDEAALKRVTDILNTGIMEAARYRSNVDGLSDEERDDLVRDVLEEADDVPASAKAALKEAVTRHIEQAAAGDVNAARQAARAAAYRISSALPRTWTPKSDRMTESEVADVIARIPRA